MDYVPRLGPARFEAYLMARRPADPGNTLSVQQAKALVRSVSERSVSERSVLGRLVDRARGAGPPSIRSVRKAGQASRWAIQAGTVSTERAPYDEVGLRYAMRCAEEEKTTLIFGAEEHYRRLFSR